MTTLNQFNQEVFIYGTSIFAIVAYAMKFGLDTTRKIIKNTYCKEDSDYYISLCEAAK